MNSAPKQDEHYVDGKDKWTLHSITSEDTRINPGDYKEIVQILKNGERVGQTTWHKDKSGADRNEPYREGVQEIPSTAKKVKGK